MFAIPFFFPAIPTTNANVRRSFASQTATEFEFVVNATASHPFTISINKWALIKFELHF